MRQSVRDAISKLPEPLRVALEEVMKSRVFDWTLSADEVNRLRMAAAMSDRDVRFALLPVAAAMAVPLVSKFYVGALAGSENGTLYFGANMEFRNSSVGQSVHAEQSAICHAWSKGVKVIKDITVNYSPCGHCRQFMAELPESERIRVEIPEESPKTLAEYLPCLFSLPVDSKFLQSPLLPQMKLGGEECPLTLQAAEAARKSYVPFSKGPCGVAIRVKGGKVFVGHLGENSAFNPSIPPMQVALICANMDGCNLADIEAAVVVETDEAPFSYGDVSRALVAGLAPRASFKRVAAVP